MNNKISIIKIIEDTVVDGPGFRISIYSAGCSHFCKGCHNPESWDINTGTLMDIDYILDRVIKSKLNVTFSGGDPFFQIEGFYELAKKIKTHTNQTIWCYTGFCFEDILSSEKYSPILEYLDVLVDGKFMVEYKETGLIFKGSTNQRIIDVQKSLDANQCILFNYNPFPVF